MLLLRVNELSARVGLSVRHFCLFFFIAFFFFFTSFLFKPISASVFLIKFNRNNCKTERKRNRATTPEMTMCECKMKAEDDWNGMHRKYNWKEKIKTKEEMKTLTRGEKSCSWFLCVRRKTCVHFEQEEFRSREFNASLAPLRNVLTSEKRRRRRRRWLVSHK